MHKHKTLIASSQRQKQPLLVSVLAALAAYAVPASAGAQTGVFEEFTVTSGSSANPGKEDLDWFCSLSGVKGDFSGNDNGDNQNVHVFRDSNRYRVHAGSGRTARMICSRWSNFVLPAGSGILFGDIETVAIEHNDWDSQKSKSMWWGDAVTVLQGMSGEFQSGNEQALALQSSVATSPSTLRVTTDQSGCCDNTTISASAQSFFAGNSSNGRLARFVGYNTSGNRTIGNVNSSGTFQFPVATDSGFSSYWLAKTSGSNSGHCYFTRLSGDFDGNGESATITAVSGIWKLTVTAGSGNSAKANARCAAYDQR